MKIFKHSQQGAPRAQTPGRQVVAPSKLLAPESRALIRAALCEDLGAGDLTSNALVPPQRLGRAAIWAQGHYVVAGMPIARRVFQELDPQLHFTVCVRDGQQVGPGQPIARLAGRLRSILAGERTALNFLQKMTGIASLTARFVAKVKPYRVLILDTRKTTPLLRGLEKYAVLCGGGANHRQGLYDQALIKDNHRRLWAAASGSDLAAAIDRIRRRFPGLAVEVEVESPAELINAISAAPDWILLDNMTPRRLRRCVALNAGRCRLEASGGITLKNVAKIAASGVDAISLGCLTHSAPAADLSLELAEDR